MWQTIIKNYFSFLFLLLSVVLFGKILLESKEKVLSKKTIFTFLITCLLYTIVYTFFQGTIKTVLISIINMLLYKILFKTSYSKSIILSLMYMILLIIPDITELLFITKILGYDKEYCYNVFANSIPSNIIISSLMIFLTYNTKFILKLLINIKIEDNVKIIIYNILTFVCVIIFFYKAFIDIVIDINFFIKIFIMISFLTILGSFIKQTMNNNKLTKEYDNLLEFMTTFEMEIEKQRIQRHETKNEFLTIRAKLCDNQKNNEIVNYIDEILQEKIKVKQEQYAKFGYLPANGIKGLCYFKVQEAENKGIKVGLNVSTRIKSSCLNNLTAKEQKEFGRILGVLLDNAIEASTASTTKKIGIEFYSNSSKEVKMLITNTYGNNIDKDKIGKERFSTKGKNRGHGLLLIKQIINNNPIYEMKTEITNELYTQIINVKKV